MGKLARCGVLWFPDWPVTAWRRAAPEFPDADAAVAVVETNRVVSCSAPARADGVCTGQRVREAQASCPSLRLVVADADRDYKMFLPLVDQLEQVVPGIQVIRPGLVALRIRGPSKYYGGESQAVAALFSAMAQDGVSDVSAGVADGLFAAEQAAYDSASVCIVPQEGSPQFLAPLPVNRLGDDELASLLPKLGVRTLGQFAAMSAAAVRGRFGERGVRLHALASGLDSRPIQPRTPPVDLSAQIDFEPPLEMIDQVGFAVRATVEKFVAQLTAQQLVCTELRVCLTAAAGESVERVWLHPGAFDAGAVLDRVRWQLQAAVGVQLCSGLVRVVLEPVAVDEIANHAPGLFGTGPDERVHSALSRMQAILGQDGVLTASIGGGRRLVDRQVLTPWGRRSAPRMPDSRPWPGRLTGVLPTTVFSEPLAISVLDQTHCEVHVSERGTLSQHPAVMVSNGCRRAIIAWAGPWPIDEHWWDSSRRWSGHRFQIVDDVQVAWLLSYHEGGWQAEGRYD